MTLLSFSQFCSCLIIFLAEFEGITPIFWTQPSKVTANSTPLMRGVLQRLERWQLPMNHRKQLIRTTIPECMDYNINNYMLIHWEVGGRPTPAPLLLSRLATGDNGDN